MSNADDRNGPVTGYPATNGGYSAHPPPSGAAYPYPAAPPQTNPFYNYPNNPNHPHYQGGNYDDPELARRANCIRLIFASVIGLVIIFGTVTFIVWLVLRPQLPEFRVDSFSISNFTLGNNSLVSFTSEIRLTARNPNRKMSIVYDHIEAVIYYKSDSISGTTALPPFSQDTKIETSLTANFAAAGSFVDREVADGINSDRAKNGNVDFNFRMLSRVRFEAPAWKTRRRYLRVFCGELIVSIPSNGRSGALTGVPPQCRVGV